MYLFSSAKKIKLYYLQLNLRKHSVKLIQARGNMIAQNYHCQKLLQFSMQLQSLQTLMQEEANLKATKTIISHFDKAAPNLANSFTKK